MSLNLASHWEELDAFEGDGYARVPVVARLDSGEVVDACVYALSNCKSYISMLRSSVVKYGWSQSLESGPSLRSLLWT